MKDDVRAKMSLSRGRCRNSYYGEALYRDSMARALQDYSDCADLEGRNSPASDNRM